MDGRFSGFAVFSPGLLVVLDVFLFQVGYAVPAVLCGFIGFRPHVTGRQESLTNCTETTSSFLFCTLEEKLLDSAPLQNIY